LAVRSAVVVRWRFVAATSLQRSLSAFVNSEDAAGMAESDFVQCDACYIVLPELRQPAAHMTALWANNAAITVCGPIDQLGRRMILVYNEYGIWMFIAGLGVFTVAILATAPFGLGWVAIYLTGFVWIASDLFVRGRNGRRWFATFAGGHLYLFPIWLIGLLLIAGGVAMQRSMAADDRAKASAERQFDQRLQDLRRHLATRAADEPGGATTPESQTDKGAGQPH
jgi:hypothetical protein